MKKLLLAIAVLFTLAGCSAPTDTASAPEQSEVSAEKEAKPKWGYTKVNIFDGPKGGACVRIKDWDFASVSGSNCAILVYFSDETIYKGGKAFLPQGTYMLLDGKCPICSD